MPDGDYKSPADTLQFRWEPGSDAPIPYYGKEYQPTKEDLEAAKAKAAQRRVEQAMAPGIGMMQQGNQLYGQSAMNYPLGLLYTAGGGLDAAAGWLSAQAANSGYNPFVDTETDRNRFQRDTKLMGDMAGLATGMNPQPYGVASLLPSKGRQAVQAAPQKPFMDAGPLPRQPGLTLWQGSPTNFSAELKVRMPDGTEQFIAGTPKQYPDLPPGATVIGEYPYGRLRGEFNLSGEGQAAFGPGHYLAQRRGIAEDYRRTLSGDTYFSDGKEMSTPRMLDHSLLGREKARIEDAKLREEFPEIPKDVSSRNYLRDKVNIDIDSEASNEYLRRTTEALDRARKEFDDSLAGTGVKVKAKLSDVIQPIKSLPKRLDESVRTSGPQSQGVAKVLGYKSTGAMNRANAAEAIRNAVSESFDALKKTRGRNITKSEGRLYEHVLPEKLMNSFVDQNAPFSKQPKVVQEALVERFGKPIPDDVSIGSVMLGKDPFSTKISLGKNQPEARALADFLASKGIPGSRFLDASSRSPGVKDVTQNYVLFSDDLTDIINKYRGGGVVSLL